MKKQWNEPVFLTDQNHIIILEAITGTPNAALPDSLAPFEILLPNTSGGAAEKHLPKIETAGIHVTVTLGNNGHPMSGEHSISFICLVTQAGAVMRVYLNPDCKPVAHFTVEEGDAPAAAYAFCNLHGLWKTEA